MENINICIDSDFFNEAQEEDGMLRIFNKNDKLFVEKKSSVSRY